MVPTRNRRRRAAEDAVDRLAISVVDVPVEAVGALAELRAHTRLRMPDCCVLVTAERHDGAAIATFDDRLGAVAAERGITVRG